MPQSLFQQEHYQFIIGSRNYGYGNLKEIHDANCIPTRTYDQLTRYWRWYVTDLTEAKGFVLNYHIKGKINGLPGKEWGWNDDDDDDDESKKRNDDTNVNDDGNDDSMICEESRKEGGGSTRWTVEERNTIIRGMALYGKDYTKLSTLVPTRTANAIGKYIRAHSLSSTT